MEDILKITIPALLVLATTYLLVSKLQKNESNRRDFELRKNNLSTVTPIRFRAYERLVLLLERTTPTNLILAASRPEMTVLELQTQLLATIRQEFSHNSSQQIYVSSEAWSYIKGTQESLLQLINACSGQCNANASAAELAEMIIRVYESTEKSPSEMAMEVLKKEIATLF